MLRLRGVEVGRNFTARALPILVKDGSSTISIQDDVILKGQVDLRATKGANLVLKNGVRLDKDVRIVATNNANVTFDENADIGCYSIFNCGTDLYVGRYVLMAGFCYIQTSNHNFSKDQIIQSQGYTHRSIYIGDDCWLGGGSFILSGVKLGNGVVVGANSVVNKDFLDFNIVAGSPATIIGMRQ